MNRFFISIILLILLASSSYAQHLVPLHRHRLVELERLMLQDSETHHTALKPFVIPDTGKLFTGLYAREGKPGGWIEKKLRYENLIMKEDENYRFTADPVLDFQFSKNRDHEKYFYRNTRGFNVTGRIGKKVAFHSVLFENQVAFQPYINRFIANKKVIPHAASYKLYEAPFSQLAPEAYDFAMAEGVLSWSVIPELNLQMGQGKHFIGDGYRSLLLSDNSYSYPFVKATATVWKIQYTAMFAEMLDMDLPNDAESGYRKKRSSIQFVNFKVLPWLQAGLFEATVYQPEDSTGYKGFKANYINPVILSRTIEYGLNSKNNTLLGANLRIQLPLKLVLYGQFVLDEAGDKNAKKLSEKASRYGYQLGAKWFDVLNIEQLYVQAEYNVAMPYLYATNPASQNFGHVRQSLAHPLGANFKEFVGLFQYQYHDFALEIQANYARYGTDTSQFSFGKDIYKPAPELEYGEEVDTHITQGISTKMAYARAQLSYILNPRTDMRIYLEAALRKEASDIVNYEDVFISFGLRTFLSNRLFDF